MRKFGTHDEAERRRWQNPEKVLERIGLREGMVFADIGCGDGFFSIPAARIVGEEGAVLALDIDAGRIAALRKKADGEGLSNIITRVGEAEEVTMCQGCADVVFFGIVLHDFRDQSKVLLNARMVMKPDGKLANLDWKKERMDLGPPFEIRFDEDYASDLIRKAGFEIASVSECGVYHYLIIAR